MGDPINVFGGAFKIKPLSPKEIAKMRKNMKKVPEIQLKSDIYHEREIQDADQFLGTAIVDNELEKIDHKIYQTPYQKITFRQRITLRLKKLFISRT